MFNDSLFVLLLSRPLIRYGGQNGVQSCMSVRFNAHGSQVLSLRRRLPPILYNTFSEDSICQFYHPDYYNSCTMKSCSFAGENDEYVISGSDDFNLYIWRVADADCECDLSFCEFHENNNRIFLLRFRRRKNKSMDRHTPHGAVWPSLDRESSAL